MPVEICVIVDEDLARELLRRWGPTIDTADKAAMYTTRVRWVPKQLNRSIEPLQLPPTLLHDNKNAVLQSHIRILDLNVRAYNCLTRLANVHGISYPSVAWLIEHDTYDLLAITNFGEKSLEDVQARLSAYGLELKEL